MMKNLKNKILLFILNKCHFISDKKYLQIRYKLIYNKKLDLSNPVTFNEKLQWIKLNDRKDAYTKMVDKKEAKEYVSKIIGDQYIIPTLGIYDSFDEINFDELPKKFVIKCTHDSGGLAIIKDKNNINKKKLNKKFKKYLKRNFYYNGREWPYKNVKPRIIIEKYLEDSNCESIKDYKFFCFNGNPKIMYLSEGLENHSTARMSFYDMDFKLVDCKRTDFELLEYKPEIPKNFELMKHFAALLSKNIPHIRVDFYEVNGELYFGELTFFTCSGFVPFESEKWNKILGNYIDLGCVINNEK